MANCSGCPYRWHDEDCEYCSMKGDEVIDLKSYSKETCSYYQAYKASRGGSSSSSSGSSSYSSSDDSGCGKFFIIAAIIIAIIVGIAFFVTNSSGEKKSDGSQKTAIVYNVNHALNMRDAASSGSNVIATVPKGETVIIIEEGTDYHLVKYGEQQGYCAAECLDIQ